MGDHGSCDTIRKVHDFLYLRYSKKTIGPVIDDQKQHVVMNVTPAHVPFRHEMTPVTPFGHRDKTAEIVVDRP